MTKPAAAAVMPGDVLSVQPVGARSTAGKAGKAGNGGARSFLLEVRDEAASKVLLASLPLLDRLLVEKNAELRERRLEEMVDFMAGQMLVPSPVDLEMAQRLAVRHARILNEFGHFTAEQLAAANRSKAASRSALADNWRKRRQVFALPHASRSAREPDVYPAFQFEDHQPIKAVASVLEAFGERKAPWKLALWFTSNNGWLPGSRRPVDLLASNPGVGARGGAPRRGRECRLTCRAPTPPLDPLFERWPAGEVIHVIHDTRCAPRSFNPGVDEQGVPRSPTRFAPIRDRLGKVVPYLYGGSTREVAIFETVFHNVPIDADDKFVDLDDFAQRGHGQVVSGRELRLVDLTTDGLHRLKLPKQRLIGGAPRDYPATARWAEALHRQFEDVDGLLWMSRQRDRDRALLLFGDRVRSALTGTRIGGALARNAPLREAVLALALRVGIEAA